MREFLMALAVALAHVATDATAARGEATDLPSAPIPARILAASPGLTTAFRGPKVWPGHLVILEPDGRMRTLELDDLTPLRVRITIPF